MLLAVAALLLQPLAIPQNLLAPVAALAANTGADSPSVAVAPSVRPRVSAATPDVASAASTTPLFVPEFEVSA